MRDDTVPWVGNRIDLTGRRFGSLVVVRYGGFSGGRARWWCECDCGRDALVLAKWLRDVRRLRFGVRCGFRGRGGRAELRREDFPEYGTWERMRARCGDERRHNFHRYGGRG